MEKDLLEFATTKVDEMLAAPSASQTTRTAAQTWKDVVASGGDPDVATERLLDVVCERQTSIDSLISLIDSERGKLIFGDAAEGMLAHERARKAAGARFCDCAACRPCHELATAFGREEADVYL